MHPATKPLILGCVLPAAVLGAVIGRDVWVERGGGPFAGPAPLLVLPYAALPSFDPGVGDLDSDGVPDLLLGSTRPGVFAEVLSGATGETILRLTGNAWAEERRRAAAAGDCDGDGVGDVLVGIDDWGPESGHARLFSGADGHELHAWEGADGDRYGRAIAGPGDLDGDGRDDVVVGAPGAGYVEVRSGFDGSRLHRWEAPDEGTSFGRRIVLLGDLDGDRRAELGIMDRFEEDDRLHVYSTANWERSLVLADADLRLTTTSATADEDGDGVRDLLVGAKRGARIISGADGSSLRVLLAGMDSPRPVPLGDYDGDGLDDLLVFTLDAYDHGLVLELNSYATLRVVSGRTSEFLLEVAYPRPFASVYGPGDLNGDGCDDFWVAFEGELRAYSGADRE